VPPIRLQAGVEVIDITCHVRSRSRLSNAERL
jgi:hypothetical protein